MRDAIQGMLSMSQMGRLPYSSSSTLLSSSKSSKKSSAYFDDLDLQMKTCYKDNDFGEFYKPFIPNLTSFTPKKFPMITLFFHNLKTNIINS